MKEKVKSISLKNLRNNEDFTFQKEFADIANKYLSAVTAASAVLKQHKTDLQVYDKELNKVGGVSGAALADEADAERDHAWSGANAYISAVAGYHPTESVKTAADQVYSLFDKFGNPTKMSYSEETSVIQNLIDSIGALPAKTLSDCAFTPWQANLVLKQNNYIKAAASKNQSESAVVVGRIKDARNAVDDDYKAVVETINALSVIQSDSKITSFINEINNLIDLQRTVIKTRKTIAEKSKIGEGASAVNTVA